MAYSLRVLLVLVLFATVSCPVSWAGDYVENDKNMQELGDVEPDLLPQRNPFNFSISVREEYDDNTNTSETDPEDAFKTWLTPSIVFTAPMDNTLISLGLTYSAVFFLDTENERVNQRLDFLTSINHTFSDRVNLDFRNRFRYSQEPEALDDLTVFEVDGSYIINSTSVQLGVEWTPLLGTTTLYTFDYYDYTNNGLATVNDRISNYIRQDFRFLVWPTVTLVAGGGFRDTTYINGALDRDFQNVYGDFGADWQALPNLVIGARAGIIVTSTQNRSDVLNPSGSMYVNWDIGARSSLAFRFSQDVTPTDLAFEDAQYSSTATLVFSYEFTPRLTGEVQGAARIGQFDEFLSPSANTGNGFNRNFDEDIGSISLGLTYRFNDIMSANGGYTYSTRISPLPGREYDRNRVYLGLTASF